MWKRYFAFVMAMTLMFHTVPMKVFAEEGMDSAHSGTEAVEVEEKSEGEDEADAPGEKEQFDEEECTLSENDLNEDALITGGDGAKEDIGSERETGECGAEDEAIDGELLPNESVDSEQKEKDAAVSVENGEEETDGGDGQSNSIEKSDGNIASGRYKNEEDGSDITWEIDANGKLTIEGVGNFRSNENVRPPSQEEDSWHPYPWTTFAYRIKTAEIKATGTTDASDIFRACENMQSVNLSDFDTSKVKDMSYMFYNCSSIQDIDLSSFDTGVVTNMERMFSGCNSLSSINISSFDTSHIINMIYMFSGCSSLENLDLSNFDTSAVTNMQGMFSECRQLMEVNLSSFNTSKVYSMPWMFEECEKLVNLDISSFSTDSLEIMWGMFSGCKSLARLDLSNFNLSNMWDDGNGVFKDCEALGTICTPYNLRKEILLPFYEGYVWCEPDGSVLMELPQKRDKSIIITKIPADSGHDIAKGEYKENGSNITWRIDGNGKLVVEGEGDLPEYAKDNMSKWERAPWYSKRYYIRSAEINVTNMTDASYLLHKCNKMSAIDLRNFDTSQVTTMQGMFRGCGSLKELDLSSLDTANVTDMSYMFSMCNENDEISEGEHLGPVMLNLSGFKTEKVINMSDMFSGCGNLTNLDLSSFDTDNVTSMNGMFGYCSSLTGLDVRVFRTEKVTDMRGMFSSCINLKKLDLSSFDTGNVTDMSNMFSHCKNLTSLNIGNFNTSKVTTMEGMFQQNHQLTSLDVSGFDTGNVTDMGSMFDNCRKLISLDVDGFDTHNVTNMGQMFYDCGQDSIKLDVSGFDTGKVTNMSGMFLSCGVSELDVSNFDIGNVTDMSYMFASPSLIKVDVSGFNTSKVRDMSYLFQRCNKITRLDLSSFDAVNLGRATGMFQLCTMLNRIDTPKNLKQFIELPKAESGDAWQDGAGNTYTELPMNLGYSITISRKGGSGSTETGKQTLSVSGIEIGDKVYDGDPNSYTGAVVLKDASGKLVSDVSLTHSYSGTIADGSVYVETEDGPSQVGNYTLTFAVTGASADQYVLNQPEYSFCITPKEATIVAKTVGIEIGGQIPKLSELKYIVNGLVKNDELIKKPSFRYSIENISTAKEGQYGIIPYDADAGINYDLKYVNGILSVGIPVSHITLEKTKTSYITGENLTTDDLTVTYHNETGDSFIVSGYETNVDEIDMSTPGRKTLVVIYNGLTAEIALDVYASWIEILKLSSDSLTLSVGETAALKVVAMESVSGNTLTLPVTWASSDPSVATVEDGLVTAVSVGECIITASADGKSAVCYVTVTAGQADMIIASGSYENVNWQIDGSGKLTVEGSGEFTNSNAVNRAPWFDYWSFIKSAEINLTDTTNASYLFNGCQSLMDVDVREFDTGNVTDMTGLFQNCSSLTSINLSNCDMQKVTNITDFFKGCQRLSTIYAPCNLKMSVELPRGSSTVSDNSTISGNSTVSGDIWYDIDGNTYTELPRNLSRSIVLTRNQKPVISEPYIILEKGKIRYVIGEKLNTDDLKVTYYNETGISSRVNDYTTNANEIDMSTPGTKTLVVTYRDLRAEIKITVSEKQTEETPETKGLKITFKNEQDRESVYTGSAIKPEIKVSYNGRPLVEGTNYTVKYANNVKAGYGRITVTGKGNFRSSKTQNFAIVRADIANAELAGTDKEGRLVVASGSKFAPIIYYGSQKLTAKDYSISGAVMAGKKITDSDSNKVVTIKGRGNYTGDREIVLRVVRKSDLTKFTVTLDQTKLNALTYDGKGHYIHDIQGALTVIGKDGNTNMKRGMDYRIVYPANVTDAGVKKFSVVGMGLYTGTVSKSYTIKPAVDTYGALKVEYVSGSIDNIKLPYRSTGVTFNEKLKITYTQNGDTFTLREGKDYKVTYSGNKKIGSNAKFTISFLGNYKGIQKQTRTFTIEKADLKDAAVVIADAVYKKNPGIYKSIPYVIEQETGRLIKASNYHVTYYVDENRNREMKGQNKVSSGDTVYVKIEAKPNSNYKSDMPLIQTYRVTNAIDLSKAKISFVNAETGTAAKSAEYTGQKITDREIKVLVDGKPADENMIVTYADNIDKGQATVIVTGTGEPGCRYTGCKKAAFSIVAYSLR